MSGDISLLAASPPLRNQMDPGAPKRDSAVKFGEDRLRAASTSIDGPEPSAQNLEESPKEAAETRPPSARSDSPGDLRNNRTGISFTRNLETGKMYLEITDRKTGEVIHKIPKQYLESADGSGSSGNQLNELV